MVVKDQHFYQLRSARQGDKRAIRALVHQARLNPLGLDWQRFVVVESAQGVIVGCGQLKPHSAGAIELASLVVHPDWRLRGVAKVIIDHLLSTYSGDIYLTCRASLGKFYLRYGFRAVEEANMPVYFQVVSRLFRLFKRLRRGGEGLLVMKRPGTKAGNPPIMNSTG